MFGGGLLPLFGGGFWPGCGHVVLEVCTLLGSGGIGWLALVPGSSQTGSPPTEAWPRPGGYENHSPGGAFSVSSAFIMNSCHAGAAA